MYLPDMRCNESQDFLRAILVFLTVHVMSKPYALITQVTPIGEAVKV